MYLMGAIVECNINVRNPPHTTIFRKGICVICGNWVKMMGKNERNRKPSWKPAMVLYEKGRLLSSSHISEFLKIVAKAINEIPTETKTPNAHMPASDPTES